MPSSELSGRALTEGFPNIEPSGLCDDEVVLRVRRDGISACPRAGRGRGGFRSLPDSPMAGGSGPAPSRPGAEFGPSRPGPGFGPSSFGIGLALPVLPMRSDPPLSGVLEENRREIVQC